MLFDLKFNVCICTLKQIYLFEVQILIVNYSSVQWLPDSSGKPTAEGSVCMLCGEDLQRIEKTWKMINVITVYS